MVKTLLAIIFSAGSSVKSNKQINKKIAEMNAKGAGIWINGKKHPLG